MSGDHHLEEASDVDASQGLQPKLLSPVVLREKDVLDVSLSSDMRS